MRKGVAGTVLFLGLLMAFIFVVLYVAFNDLAITPIVADQMSQTSGMDRTVMSFIVPVMFMLGLIAAILYKN